MPVTHAESATIKDVEQEREIKAAWSGNNAMMGPAINRSVCEKSEPYKKDVCMFYGEHSKNMILQLESDWRCSCGKSVSLQGPAGSHTMLEWMNFITSTISAAKNWLHFSPNVPTFFSTANRSVGHISMTKYSLFAS